MTNIITEYMKRFRWLWLTGALFSSAVLAIVACDRTIERPTADPLTAAERAWLKAHPVIRLAPDPDFPPVEYFDRDGGYSGMTADYIALMEKKLGIRFKIIRLRNWNEVIDRAKSRQIDLFVASDTPQRAEYMLFTRPFLEYPAVIISREKVKGPLTLEDLSGTKVSVVSGYATHDFIAGNYPKLRLDPVPDVRTGLRKVSFGLSDAFVESLATASYYIEKEGISNLRISGDSGYMYRMGFCTRRDWPVLNRILEKGVAGISSGEKKAIYKKWIPLEHRSLLTSRTFQTGLVATFTAILAIAAGIIAWNRTLARQVSQRTGELERELAQRKRMEGELERSRHELEKRVEERTRELAETVQALRFTQFAVDSSNDQAFWMTNDGHFFYVNDAACRTLGYSRDELVTMSVSDIDPSCSPEMVAQYWRVLREHGSDTFETSHCTKDGRVYPVEIRSNLLIFNENEFNCCFATDITARKRVENINMTRLRLLQLAGTHSLDELIEATLDEIEALTGSLIGFYVFVHEDQKTLSLQNWSTRTKREYCTAEGKGLHYDVSLAGVWTDCIHQRRPVIHNDYASLSHRKGLPPGHAPLIRELTVPIFRGENIVAIIAVGNKPTDYSSHDVETVSLLADLAWEVTEQKRMEEELLLSHFCINKAAIGIYHTSPRGEILSANDFACQSLGYTADELRTLNVSDIDPLLTEEKVGDIKRLLETDGSVTHESVHRRKDGTTFPVEVVTNTLEYRGTLHDFSFVKDITDRKRAEEALQESESHVRRKLENILDPEGDMAKLELADILDAPQIQALMDDLHSITGLKMSIIDLKGQVLADMGWQDICGKYHRVHPETLKRCLESDSELAVGVPPGEFKTYRCKNNMWHLVTPIIVGGTHMGNLFMGQFFFTDEQIDYDLFRSQARTYGFPEEEYIAALEAVPRHSEEKVNQGKALFLRLIDMFSKLSYANIKLAHSLAERDRLTATLREANMVVENSPVVLFRCKPTPDWPVELVSQNVMQFGYTPDEFISGKLTYAAIVHPDDVEWVTDETDEYAVTGEGRLRQEYRIVTKGGEIRWIIDETNCELNEAGEIDHFEGVIIDVTERKLAEEELQQQKRLLQELNDTLERRIENEVRKSREKDIVLIQQNRQAALGEMLDHIAHQWKQPLNSISLIVQEMAYSSSDGELTDEQVQETIGKIMSLLEHMGQTIDVFRGFYRPDKQKRLFSIKESIDQALSFIAPAFRFQSIAVEIDVDPGLTGFGYPKEYSQALLNILVNAREIFRARKTEEPRVILRGFAEGSRSIVTITDNAGGIPEAVKERIFDFYFTTNEAGGGTGIGLYMSKNIVEKNMDGKLGAGNVDGGAQFRIEIPSA